MLLIYFSVFFRSGVMNKMLETQMQVNDELCESAVVKHLYSLQKHNNVHLTGAPSAPHTNTSTHTHC